MWQNIVSAILRNRLANILIIGFLTLVMCFYACKVKMSYEMIQMLRDDDPTQEEYQKFKDIFGADGNTIFVGFSDDKLFELEYFHKWSRLIDDVSEFEGVAEVMALPNALNLVKNEDKQSFDLVKIFDRIPVTQAELDSMLVKMYELPFYDGRLYASGNKAVLMMVYLDPMAIDSKDRIALTYKLKDMVDAFGEKNEIKPHYSGLPYIRTITSETLKNELIFFLFLSMLVATLALYLFFRSWRVIILPMIIVAVNIIWALGLISIFKFEITALTGIIPPLLVIIGVENSIFLINKYHQEYRSHENKVLALSRSISRIGRANLLTNITTAIGFSAFIITGNKILVEFGIVAAVSIVTSYLFTLILLPIFFSYTNPPKVSHTRHLDNKLMWRILEKAEYWVSRKRIYVYAVFIVLLLVSAVGALRLKSSASIMDDVSKKSALYLDMQFFEQNFKGVLPLEIVINTKKEKGVIRYSFLKKLDELNEELATYTDLSKPLSILEVVKFAKQAYYNGDPAFYALPSQHEMGFMMSYLPSFEAPFKGQNAEGNSIMQLDDKGSLTANEIISDRKGIEGMGTVLRAYVDSNLQIARVGVQMMDLSTEEILDIKNTLEVRLDEIFDTARYDVSMTGNSIVFLEGTEYLTANLLQSLLLAALLIALMMFFLFSSWQMVLLAVIPNLLPQLLTAAVMGYVGIPIKVSTILIFSVALGISVDNTIHFLSRYRMELMINKDNRRQAVLYALGEAGFSMLYSSIILFLGFSMFALSSFGGTQWMGILVSLTLVVALLANLLLLPSLLLSFDKYLRKKLIFKERAEDKLDSF